ncbi:MAG: helix-turn-helix transcriptional regulator [Oscillospiraceae bacterium]|jgi:transcriptional regulator with XRE-family HTH domain|nr:helix-turn-helix transcriptional regulator [Oscillospiraceae bacterium]
MSKFKNVFKNLRLKKGLTQDELAVALGMSKSAISMYENGNREPDFETLEAIADYFNVDMNQLHGWEEEISSLEKQRVFYKRKIDRGEDEEHIFDMLDMLDMIDENIEIVMERLFPSSAPLSDMDEALAHRFREISGKFPSDEELKSMRMIVDSAFALIKRKDKDVGLNDLASVKEPVSDYLEAPTNTLKEQPDDDYQTSKAAHHDGPTDEEELRLLQEDMDEL